METRNSRAAVNGGRRRAGLKKLLLCIILIGAVGMFASAGVYAAEIGEIDEPLADALENFVDALFETADAMTGPAVASDAVNIILLLTVITLAPSILILLTGFTRILIVLSFVRNALGLQQTPPTQVLVGIALFLTIFLMAPIFTEINETALQPYINEELTLSEAIDAGMEPVRRFMFEQLAGRTGVGARDVQTFLRIAGQDMPETIEEIGNEVLIPAFIMGEIRRAFIMGFFIYVPFLIIDLVVASTLMSLGMMMLPPAMVSMPFKLILFMLVDGWSLIVGTLMESFFP